MKINKNIVELEQQLSSTLLALFLESKDDAELTSIVEDMRDLNAQLYNIIEERMNDEI